MSSQIKSYLDSLDKKIRLGELEIVQKELEKLNLNSIPREHAATLATLARRVSLSNVAVSILYPLVRPKDRKQVQATEIEIAEYAAALTFIGASQEAYGLLRKVNSQKVPQALLYQAFALFAQWNYRLAIPAIKQYIETPTLSDYERLVGKLNLGAAFLYERDYELSFKLLKEVAHQAKEKKYHLLYSNALERLAENSICLKNWNTAENLLFEAESLIHDQKSLYKLFIRKWRVFLNISTTGLKDREFVKLKEILAEATNLNHWETVRDCNRFEAITTKNKKLLYHLYFGTPYKSFRERLISDFGAPISLPTNYYWGQEFIALDKSSPELDLETGKVTYRNELGVIESLKTTLTPGSLPHRFLKRLSTDFYAPIGLRILFADLFSNDPYDPNTSDSKIRSVAKELESWFAVNHLSLKLEERNGFFHLKFTAPFVIKISR